MTRSRRRWPWLVAGILVAVLLTVVAIVVVPIVTHRNQGLPNQDPATEEWPRVATGHGDDGRDRRIEIAAVDGGAVDTSALRPGDRFVLRGEGFDASQGIYVAICAIPDDPAIKPGPCLGGVPSQDAVEVPEGTVQFAPSNWINDDWAWKLFGARSYDDRAAGTFTAYIEVPEPADEHVDCRQVRCAVYTRNDHTALGDRVQDLYIPIRFADE